MKPVTFIGDSLDAIRDFPALAKNEAGLQLARVQQGLDPGDWKPMNSIGSGVRELRARDPAGAFEATTIAALPDAAYVLHAFQKKTQKTAQCDLAIATRRLIQIVRSTTQ